MIFTGKRNARTPSSAARWLILLALAWSQASFAAHQFEHSIADAGKVCTTCVQFDRQDDMVVPTEAIVAEATAILDFTPPSVLTANSRAFSHYQSRASP